MDAISADPSKIVADGIGSLGDCQDACIRIGIDMQRGHQHTGIEVNVRNGLQPQFGY